MTTPYVPVPALLPASINLPQDVIDPVNAASVNPVFQTCLDTLAALDVWQTGGTITAATPVTFDGQLSVLYLFLSSAAALVAEAGSEVFLDGLFDADGTVRLGGDIEIDAPIKLAAGGKLVERVFTVVASGDQTIQGAQYDTVYVPDGVIVNGDAITIGDVGAQDGMKITIFTEDNANAVFVKNSGGGTISSGLVVGVNTSTALVAQRIGGAWRRVYQAREVYT
jgi:hypothetical protein